MSMSSAKITIAFIFIFAVSQSSQHPGPPAEQSYYNEFCVADVQAKNETLLQEALDWACANGADCIAIKPGQPCYLPNTLIHHASYAFNSYYQKHKHNVTASCYYKAAMVVTASDPSCGPCYFHLTY